MPCLTGHRACGEIERSMSEALDRIRHHRIGLVVHAPTREALIAYGVAAAEGGVRILALPAAVPDVAEIIAELSDVVDATVGVAQVVKPEQVSLAIAAGAEFVLSPLCDEGMVRTCRDRGLVMVCGAATPNEIHRAISAEPDLLALYPAALIGGPYYVTYMQRQFSDVPFVAFGGVDVDSGPAYLEAGAAAIFIDVGLFPAEPDPEALPVITTRTQALLEVCSEVVGTPL